MTQTQLRRDRRRRARVWSLSGYALMLIGMLTCTAGRLIARDLFGYVGDIIAALFGMATAMIGTRYVIYAKRLGAPSALDLLVRDTRRPIVYFRPFTADVETSKPLISGSRFTHEEQLSRAMNDLGPFVAFGIPQESLPLIGAARIYANDSQWQATALELMERAAIVLFRIGNSSSFWWELSTAVQSLAPQKIVLLVPRNEALYEAFRENGNNFLPKALPALTAWHKKRWFRGELKAFILFDSAWLPSVIDLQAVRVPLLRFSPSMPLVPVLQIALRLVCENASLPWTAPKISGQLLLLIALFALVVIAFIGMVISGP